MPRRWKGLALAVALMIAPLVAWQLGTRAQQATGSRSRFEFVVVECFDAKYLGDTPGHTGRGGGLESTTPNAALGDPVYRGNTKVGTVTGLVWDRGKQSLTVEFDPEPLVRVSVGDTAWISIDGSTAATKKAR